MPSLAQFKLALQADNPTDTVVSGERWVAAQDPKEPSQVAAENGPDANDGTGGLKQAYDRGADKAKTKFLKDDHGSYAPRLSTLHPSIGAGFAAYEAPKGQKLKHGLSSFGAGMAGLLGGEGLGAPLSHPLKNALGNTPLPQDIRAAAKDIASVFTNKTIKLPNAATTAAFVITHVLGSVGSYYGTQLAQKYWRSKDTEKTDALRK